MASYTTYRVRGIPIGWAEDTAEARIKDALSTTGFVQVNLRSLAVDLSRPAESVATVDFASTPERLSASNGADEWRIEISNGPLLLFDTHFRGCTPLYCPSQESWRSDLFAISGLNGHAFGSFKKKKDTYMWLRDDLPRDLCETRIIVYGYDTRLEGSQSFQNVSDIGIKFQSALRAARKPDSSRPLLLLGHSLGGIIIKEAIHKMRTSPNEIDRKSFKAICGIAFFGVPNQGMQITSLVPMVGSQPNRGFLHVLEHSSPFLRMQVEHFYDDIAHLHCEVLNFYETQESPTALPKDDGTWSMSGTPTVLVTAQSATHGRLHDETGHRVYPIDCTHSDLVKFTSSYDEPYTEVVQFFATTEGGPRATSVPQLSSREERCLKSLAFREQHLRIDELDPMEGTCDWALRHKLFIQWRDSSNALLWIRGAPGSGKSMVMKKVFLYMSEQNSDGVIILSFFFHGQGIDLQKNRLGLYRSLLHQLYRYFPEVFPALTRRHEEYTREADSWSWMVGEMQRFFLEGLPEVCQRNPVVLLVDALDEAGEDEARKVVADLMTLLEVVQARTASQLRICFSCRHYPEVELKGGTTLVVERSNIADIQLVIDRMLDDTTVFSESEKQSIKQNTLARSEGIFQWATLVVQNAQQSKLEGDSTATSLKDVPESLHTLYASLLMKPDPAGQKHRGRQRRRLFQWVGFSVTPLSPRQLQHALAFDYDSGHASVDEYSKEQDFIHDNDVYASIKSLSRGLAHVQGSLDDGSLDTGTVELIHASVRDFLNDAGMQLLFTSGQSQGPEVNAHFRISRSCLRYLALKEVQTEFTTYRQYSTSLFEDLKKKLNTYKRFPLLEYSWKYWVYHACLNNDSRGRTADKPDNLDLLDYFQWPNDKTFLVPWLDAFRLLGNPMAKRRDSWYRRSDELDSNDPGQEIEERQTTQLRHRALWGSESSLNLRSFNYIRYSSEWPVKGSGLVHLLAACGFVDALRCIKTSEYATSLFRTAKQVFASPDSNNLSPLDYAVAWRRIEVMQFLLDAGVKPGTSKLPSSAARMGLAGSYRKNASIHLAILWGDEEATALLVRHGMDPDRTLDASGSRPLHMAVDFNLPAAVRAFAASGANVNARDFAGRTPLHRAVASPRKNLCVGPLLELGADPNAAENSRRQTPLFEIGCYSEERAKLLVKHGANANACDKIGWTPLLRAVVEVDSRNIVALLKAGSGVNVKDKHGNGVFQHLLFGIDISLPDSERDQRMELTRLLLQFGAGTQLRDMQRKALECALDRGDWASSMTGVCSVVCAVDPKKEREEYID